VDLLNFNSVPAQPIPAQPTSGRRGLPAMVDTPLIGLASAIRLLTTATIGTVLDDDDVAAATASVVAIAEHLEGGSSPREPDGATSRPRAARDFFRTSPMSGAINAIAPPLAVQVVDGGGLGASQIHATASFDIAYEGPPGSVHGGILAAAFDDLLGLAVFVAGCNAVTGSLEVRYRKPTPLWTELRFEARWVSQRGRKIHAWAGCFDGDTLTAEADGLFVAITNSTNGTPDAGNRTPPTS
jgi:acyl-coenzyme A thioesterase PaaI-like protein